MGMRSDLTNKNGQDFHVGIGVWWRLLSLAESHGWEPMGMMPPLSVDENGNDVTNETYNPDEWDAFDYSSHSGQSVLAKDAQNLADALERALDDISDMPIGHQYIHPTAAPLIDYWSGKENKAYMRGFIAYCRQGAFTIA